MGLYDDITVHYPLPVEGFDGHTFQTKDTPAQWLDKYEIRADGTLWHEAYDTEDRSDPTTDGIGKLFGCLTRVNKRWEPVTGFTGEIEFHDTLTPQHTGWISFSAYLEHSRVVGMNLLKYEQPAEVR